MPFGIDDLRERLGNDRIVETFTEEIASVESLSMRQLSIADIDKLFPNVVLSDTEHIAYIPTRMCNSLPTVNRRGRCFFPSVIKRSAASAQDNLVDLEHVLKTHGHSQDDVIGHIKAVRFDPQNIWQEAVELASNGSQQLLLPKNPVPLYALMAIHLRTKSGREVVKQCIEGKKKWKTSMECVADLPESGFLYKLNYIPFMEAAPEMIECVEKTRVRPYQGNKVDLCLGGMNGTVDYCGIGMTTSPADGGCDIFGMVATSVRETASIKRFMPITTMTLNFPEEKDYEKAVELASAVIEQKLEEVGSIGVIGQTQSSGIDGHVHDVLSDGSVLPFGGHSHIIESLHLTTGTNPRYTAKLHTNNEYTRTIEGMEKRVEHTHLIDISLKGKRGGKTKTTPEATPAPEIASDGEDDNLNTEDIMNLKERLAAIEAKLGSITPTTPLNEIASLREEFSKLRVSQEIANSIEEGVAAKITAGEFITADKHKEEVEAAAKKAKEEAEAAAKAREDAAAKLTSRLEKITKLGIDLECVEEGQTKTLKDIVSSIEFDDRGEREFGRELGRLETKVQLEKLRKEAYTKANEQQQVQQASKPRPFLLGGQKENELANQGGGASNGRKLPNHFATRQTIK